MLLILLEQCNSIFACLWSQVPFLLIARIDRVGGQGFVVFGADEARVAVLLEQERVHVLRGHLEGVAIRVLYGLFRRFHGLTINVDLCLCSGREKLAASRKHRRLLAQLNRPLQDDPNDLLPDLLDFLLDPDLGARPRPEILHCQPEAEVLVAVLALQVGHELLHTCEKKQNLIIPRRTMRGTGGDCPPLTLLITDEVLQRHCPLANAFLRRAVDPTMIKWYVSLVHHNH